MRSLIAITSDRTGLIAELSSLLTANNVNIAAMDGHVIGATAVLHIDVDDLPSALAVLTRAGCQVMSDEVLTVQVENVPGALARVARELVDADLDIRMIRTVSRQADSCIVTIATSDNGRARKLLAGQLV